MQIKEEYQKAVGSRNNEKRLMYDVHAKYFYKRQVVWDDPVRGANIGLSNIEVGLSKRGGLRERTPAHFTEQVLG